MPSEQRSKGQVCVCVWWCVMVWTCGYGHAIKTPMHDDKEPKTWTHVHINCFDENMQKSGHILAFSFVLSHIEATAASIFYLLNFPNSTKISPPPDFHLVGRSIIRLRRFHLDFHAWKSVAGGNNKGKIAFRCLQHKLACFSIEELLKVCFK